MDWRPSANYFPTIRSGIRVLNRPVFSPKSQFSYTLHFLHDGYWAHNRLSIATDVIQTVQLKQNHKTCMNPADSVYRYLQPTQVICFNLSMLHDLMYSMTQINVPINWSAFCNVAINQTHFLQHIKTGHIHK